MMMCVSRLGPAVTTQLLLFDYVVLRPPSPLSSPLSFLQLSYDRLLGFDGYGPDDAFAEEGPNSPSSMDSGSTGSCSVSDERESVDSRARRFKGPHHRAAAERVGYCMMCGRVLLMRGVQRCEVSRVCSLSLFSIGTPLI